MDETTLANRTAWDKAHRAQLWAYDEMSAKAATGATLVASERELLRDILAMRPLVVHPQSGNGQDDIALVQAGAREVIGVDYSETAVRVAQSRADDLGAACRYLVSTVPGMPLPDGCADLVYTAVIRAGLAIRHLEEYAEPFWRMGDVDAAAFRGRLPNSFALLASRPAAA
jgi:hypothetical protein